MGFKELSVHSGQKCLGWLIFGNKPRLAVQKSLTNFHGDEAKEKKNLKKKFQNGRLKKAHFPTPTILNILSRKFYGLILWLVELIDAKGIGVAQLIWL